MSEPASNDDLIAMLIPIAAERLTIWPVSKALGNVKNEGPELVEGVGCRVTPLARVAGRFHFGLADDKVRCDAPSAGWNAV